MPDLGGWDLWRLREVGAWGDSGRVLGAAWERLGGAGLDQELGARLVPLWHDRALGQWLGTLGVPNPDALLVDDSDYRIPAISPIDLKWSLDTAEPEQVAGATLTRLLEKAGTRLSGLIPKSIVERVVSDGRFATPDRELNRLLIISVANTKRERPIRDDDIIWLPVEVRSFFGPLPAWPVAEFLAQFEGNSAIHERIEVADRYFHLAAGLRGVIVSQERILFAEREYLNDNALLVNDSQVDARTMARLDEAIHQIGATSVRDIVRFLAPSQVARQEMRARLRGLERCPYRMADLVVDAKKRGWQVDEEDLIVLEKIRSIYREISKAHSATVRARGRNMVEAGMSTDAALDHLRSLTKEFQVLASDQAHEVLRRRP